MIAARERTLNPGRCQGPMARLFNMNWMCLNKKKGKKGRVLMRTRVAGSEASELWACSHYRDSSALTVCF